MQSSGDKESREEANLAAEAAGKSAASEKG